MDRKSFNTIKHGDRIASVRTSSPQVAEFGIHEANADEEDHPLVDNENTNFAISETNGGKSIGLVSIEDGSEGSTPEMTIIEHPNYPHMSEALLRRTLPVVMRAADIGTVALNEEATNVPVSSLENVGFEPTPLEDGHILHIQ